MYLPDHLPARLYRVTQRKNIGIHLHSVPCIHHHWDKDWGHGTRFSLQNVNTMWGIIRAKNPLHVLSRVFPTSTRHYKAPVTPEANARLATISVATSTDSFCIPLSTTVSRHFLPIHPTLTIQVAELYWSEENRFNLKIKIRFSAC